MIGLVIAFAVQASVASAAAQSSGASAPGPSQAGGPINPHANALFDRDPQLRAWALKLFDANGDGWLTLYEAQPAVRMFKEIADTDRDGRVTTQEYARAKAFITARWAVRYRH